MIRLETSSACLSCRACVDFCFVNAIAWDEERSRPVMKYGQDCQICGVCETACPAGALTIIPDWAGQYQPRLLSDERRPSYETD